MRKAKYQKALTIALPPEHFEKIKKITDENQTSLAEWVRDAIESKLMESSELE